MAFIVSLGRGMQKSFRNTTGFFRGSLQELKKVRWPSRAEMMNYTLVVMMSVLILSLFFFVIDWGIGEVVKWITNK